LNLPNYNPSLSSGELVLPPVRGLVANYSKSGDFGRFAHSKVKAAVVALLGSTPCTGSE